MFVRGNRDWAVDYSAIFPAAQTFSRLQIGDAIVWHGHQFDLFHGSLGRLAPLATIAWSLAKRVTASGGSRENRTLAPWQDRAGRRLILWCAGQLERQADLCRRNGMDWPAQKFQDQASYWTRTLSGDPNGLFEQVAEFVRVSPYRVVVCGHAHLPGVVDLGNCVYVNVGSWAHDSAHVATWDGKCFSVRDFPAGHSIGDENYRSLLLSDPYLSTIRNRARAAAEDSPAESVVLATSR